MNFFERLYKQAYVWYKIIIGSILYHEKVKEEKQKKEDEELEECYQELKKTKLKDVW